MANQNIFNKALRLFVLLLLWPFWVAAVVMAYRYLRTVNHEAIGEFWIAVGASTLFFSITWVAFQFWATLEHELAHVALAKAFFLSIHKLLVDTEGDSKVTRDEGGCGSLIPLAPYYLPLLVLPLLFVQPLIVSSAQEMFTILIGLALGFHFGTALVEFRFDQPDLIKSGRIYSIIVVFVLNVVFLVIIVAVVTNDYGAILAYFRATFEQAMAYYRQTIDAWQSGQIQAEIERILGAIGL